MHLSHQVALHKVLEVSTKGHEIEERRDVKVIHQLVVLIATGHVDLKTYKLTISLSYLKYKSTGNYKSTGRAKNIQETVCLS